MNSPRSRRMKVRCVQGLICDTQMIHNAAMQSVVHHHKYLVAHRQAYNQKDTRTLLFFLNIYEWKHTILLRPVYLKYLFFFQMSTLCVFFKAFVFATGMLALTCTLNQIFCCRHTHGSMYVFPVCLCPQHVWHVSLYWQDWRQTDVTLDVCHRHEEANR